jgi:hypothetical protein
MGLEATTGDPSLVDTTEPTREPDIAPTVAIVAPDSIRTANRRQLLKGVQGGVGL